MKKWAFAAISILTSIVGFSQAADDIQKKRFLNPWRKIPMIERFIPGITFQLQNHKGYLLDLNPMILYRLSPRFSAGAGWNYRLGLSHGVYTRGRDRVYGPRVAIQYNWKKGLSLRFLPEIMNANIDPALIASGTPDRRRVWIWGAFVGVKKDFSVFKSVRGNAEGLFNLLEQGTTTPYGDRVVLRFGFEFPLKKKRKLPY